MKPALGPEVALGRIQWNQVYRSCGVVVLHPDFVISPCDEQISWQTTVEYGMCKFKQEDK